MIDIIVNPLSLLASPEGIVSVVILALLTVDTIISHPKPKKDRPSRRSFLSELFK